MKYLVIAALIVSAVVEVAGQQPAFASKPGIAGSIASSIEAARELYASARYDEALAVLNELSSSGRSIPAERKAIEQYRSLCLLALGRGGEAEAAIAAVVRVDPFYLPSEAEASPRVRTTFADVRQRLLPDLAAARYAAAKQAYDRKEFAQAASAFRELVTLLDDPQMNGRLADLRTLAAGFSDLATAAAAPPPPKEEPAPVPPPAPEPREPRVYTSEDEGVVAPKIVRQDVPLVPNAIKGMTKDHGVIDIMIDEKGRVASVVLRSRMHPVYDTALLNAAKDWKYQPAKLNGKPVRFRKLIQISVKK